MTDPTTRTLPKSVVTRALQAIAQLQAWNAAVHQARAMEALAGCPGRFEHDLRDGTTALPLLCNRDRAMVTLNRLESTALIQSWTREALYTAIGQDRPVLEQDGPRVHDWRKAQR